MRPQWNLATIMVLTAAVATWTSYYHMSRETRRLTKENSTLSQLACELLIADPEQFGLIQVRPDWFDDEQWEVWLPPGAIYQLSVATREIPQELNSSPYPEVRQAVDLDPGKFRLKLRTEKSEDGSFEITLERDGQQLVSMSEPADWKPLTGTTTSSNGNPRSTHQQDVAYPLNLLVRRHHVADGPRVTRTPDGPANGLVIWIARLRDD